MLNYFNLFLDYFFKTGDFLNIIFYNRLNKNEFFIFVFILAKIIKSIEFRNNFLEIIPDNFPDFKAIYDYVYGHLMENIFSNSCDSRITVIFIYDFEKFNNYEQLVFLNLMEKFIKFVRFIFFCNQINNLNAEIIDRSFNIKLINKTYQFKFLDYFLKKKLTNLSIYYVCKKITNYSKFKIKKYFLKNKFFSNEHIILIFEFLKFFKKFKYSENYENYHYLDSKVNFNFLINYLSF